MDIETIRLLGRYNRETNVKMNDIFRKLTEDQWNREFQGYFRSIHALCNHIFIADYAWIKRFSSVKDFKVLNSPFFGEVLTHQSAVFDSMNDYLERREILDQKYQDLINEIEDEDLQKKFTYKTFNGSEQTKSFGGVILHVFNHQTHHRGMISLYLDIMQIDNDFSNLYHMV